MHVSSAFFGEKKCHVFSSLRGAALLYDHASLIFHCCFLRYAPLIICRDVRQSSVIFLSGLSSFFTPRHHQLPRRVHAKFPFAAVITHVSVNRQPIINTMFCTSLQFHSTCIDSCQEYIILVDYMARSKVLRSFRRVQVKSHLNKIN